MGAGTFNQPTPGYRQQQAHAQHQAHAQAQRSSGMAATGLVFGILALASFWVWGAVLFAPPAIGFGLAGRNQARREGKRGEGLGQAGLILGIVSLVLTVPWAVIVFAT